MSPILSRSPQKSPHNGAQVVHRTGFRPGISPVLCEALVTSARDVLADNESEADICRVVARRRGLSDRFVRNTFARIAVLRDMQVKTMRGAFLGGLGEAARIHEGFL